jgi:GNAT superfamily N-acetyltransferase
MIRTVDPNDFEQLLDLIELFFEEDLSSRGLRFDRDKALRDCETAYALDGIVCLVIDNHGTIDGFIAAIVMPRFFLAGQSAQELIWYVRPEARREGIRLLRTFEEVCRMRGCENIMMIGMDGTKAERLYEKLGYNKLESTYIKILGGDHGSHNNRNHSSDGCRSDRSECFASTEAGEVS